MNSLVRKLVVLVCLVTASFGSYAKEVLTLEQLREVVLDDNLDVKIQYERYYQAQQNVKVKLGEFLPSLSVQFLYWNTTYGILYSLVPTPSGWFEYQASKELAIAEKYVTESIKLNILRDLTLTFINIKHQEMMSASLKAEEKILEEVLENAQNLEALGMSSPGDTFTALRDLLQHRQQIFALDSIIAAQKEALLLSIVGRPGDEIELADFTQDTDVIPATVEEGIELGLDNAPELKANTFMAEGASSMVQSATWSFVSFSGIGFGYPSALRIEKSRAREIALEGEKVANQIENQIALAYTKMEITKKRIDLQAKLVDAAEINLIKVKELYEAGLVSLAEYVKAQRAVFSEKRGLVSIQMDQELQIAETKRLLGLDAALNDYDISAYETAELVVKASTTNFGKKAISADIVIAENLKDQIVSVVYSGDVFNTRILNISGNLSIYTKIKAYGLKTVKANILLTSGDKVELITNIEL